jgi:dienelactone hydrolase
VPRRSCVVVLVALLAGCVAVRPVTVRQQTPDQPQAAVAFVADGSGDMHRVSDNLALVAQERHVSLAVQRVGWSHGKGAILPDLYDANHQQQQGAILAQQILAFRQAHPQQRIGVVGYSAGAGVVLAAADHLPPCTLDSMVLLAPSVASCHDLRPALCCCREGIDAYHSEWDTINLMLVVLGTSDGFGSAVAGRSGFCPVIDAPQDAVLYQKLRQHCWSGPAGWQGHDGGHFGCYQPGFLREQVLPRLLGRSG